MTKLEFLCLSYIWPATINPSSECFTIYSAFKLAARSGCMADLNDQCSHFSPLSNNWIPFHSYLRWLFLTELSYQPRLTLQTSVQSFFWHLTSYYSSTSMTLLILKIFFTFSHPASPIYPSKPREYTISCCLSPPLTFYLVSPPLIVSTSLWKSFPFLYMTLPVVTSSLCFLVTLFMPLTLQDTAPSELTSHGESIQWVIGLLMCCFSLSQKSA